MIETTKNRIEFFRSFLSFVLCPSIVCADPICYIWLMMPILAFNTLNIEIKKRQNVNNIHQIIQSIWKIHAILFNVPELCDRIHSEKDVKLLNSIVSCVCVQIKCVYFLCVSQMERTSWFIPHLHLIRSDLLTIFGKQILHGMRLKVLSEIYGQTWKMMQTTC